jgi:hypothetical protein
MPGPVLHIYAVVQCIHGGQATPTTPVLRVLVDFLPVVTIAAPFTVAGCPLPPSAGGPCTTAQWVVGATRVFAMGQPVAIQTGTAVCMPTGTPLKPPTAVHQLVIAT